MAQHYKVDMDKEHEIHSSLKRIGKYIASRRWILEIARREIADRGFYETSIYRKKVDFLDDRYKEKDDFVVVAVGHYDLKRTKKEWGGFWKQNTLEVHYDREGNILKCYNPM